MKLCGAGCHKLVTVGPFSAVCVAAVGAVLSAGPKTPGGWRAGNAGGTCCAHRRCVCPCPGSVVLTCGEGCAHVM